MTDKEQQQIIELTEPNALVLAGPGCGKTYILARRIFHAIELKVAKPEDMLCLTFTNRAAREMQDRIEGLLGSVPQGLFVGNLHRFCLRFLFANRLIAPDSSILDDEDFQVFLEENIGETALRHGPEYIRRYSAWLYQEEHGHRHRLHRRLPADPSPDDELNAEVYRRYKAQNHLIDFDDILLLAYTALMDSEPGTLLMTGYKWIQVDEVQDLNPLQLALINLIQAPNAQVLYLGDERQAIFGFTGAGRDALESVRRRCAGHIYHLRHNYRSPLQLVKVCNDFAFQYLDIDPSMLPDSINGHGDTNCLQLMKLRETELPFFECSIAREFLRNKEETTAILVHTNNEAAMMSNELTRHGLEHVLIHRDDLFTGVDFKTLWCHLAVAANPIRRGEWARLLYQTRSTKTLAQARLLVARMSEAGMCPDVLLDLNKPTDAQLLTEIWSSETPIVVLDTETTGLNVFSDDVIQISAVKYCCGEIVPNSTFEIFIKSDKPLPAMLGTTPNPMVKVYANAKKVEAEEAFTTLAEYLDGCILAGHNLNFDIPILRHNISRRTTQTTPPELGLEAPRIDTLRLSQLLYPKLWSHTLEKMVEHLGLEGTNSHNASDDVVATTNLLKHLADVAVTRINLHSAYRNEPRIRRIAARFSERYSPIYYHIQQELNNPKPGDRNSLAAAIEDAHFYFSGNGLIDEIQHFHYVLDLVRKLLVDPSKESTLRDQLNAHLTDLLTFNEGDLFANGIIRERLIVMTIHKAKGMEMDNVIVFNGSNGFGNSEENLRLFYVAMSRAKRRLLIGFSLDPARRLGSLARSFHALTEQELVILKMQERNRMP